MIDLREQCELAVVAAAREERAAHAALVGGSSPPHPDWREEDEEAFDVRLERWRGASRALVVALDRLGHLQPSAAGER